LLLNYSSFTLAEVV